MTTKADDDIKEGELRLAAFIADHLPKLMQTVCKDSKIPGQIKCCRTKTTGLVNNVTGKEYREYLIQLLTDKKFPLIAHESTDKGCVKHLFIVARANDDDFDRDFCPRHHSLERCYSSNIVD